MPLDSQPYTFTIAGTGCGAGTTGTTGSCTACGAGKFKAASGSATCTNCVAGKHQAVPGSATCTDCVSGKYKAATAQTSDSSCEACPTAGHVTVPGATAASACFAGYTTYRLWVDASYGTDATAVGWLKMFTAAGTKIITDCAASGNTCSASDYFVCSQCGSNYVASQCFNDDNTNSWHTMISASKATDQWVQISFASPVAVPATYQLDRGMYTLPTGPSFCLHGSRLQYGCCACCCSSCLQSARNIARMFHSRLRAAVCLH